MSHTRTAESASERRASSRAACWLLALLAAAVGVALAAAPQALELLRGSGAVPENLGQRQQFAQKILLMTVAVAALLSPLLARCLPAGSALVRGFARLRGGLPAWAVAGCGAALYFLSYARVGRDQYLIGIALGLAVACWPPLLRPAARMRARWWHVLTGLLLAWYLLPGLGSHIIAPDYGQELDRHLLAFFAPAGQLYDGVNVREIPFRYGAVLPGILAQAQNVFGRFDAGDYARAGQVGSVVFLALFVAAYRLWSRRPLFLFLAVATTAPWVSTLQHSVLVPTSGPLRFLGFPLALLTMLLLQNRKGKLPALALGAMCALCLAYNMETGVAIVGGGLVFTALSGAGRLRDIFARLSLFKLGFLAALGLLAAGFAALYGLPPVRNLLFNILRFSGGDFGLAMFFSPLALLILVYAAATATRLCSAWFGGRLAPRDPFRLALAAMLLLWSAYYFNRPHHWNLWSYSCLFAFYYPELLRLRPAIAQAGKKQAVPLWLRRVSWPAILFSLVIFPHVVNVNLNEAKNVLRKTAPLSQPADARFAPASGVLVPADMAAALHAKADFCLAQPGRTHVLLTNEMFFLATMTRWNTSVPFQMLCHDAFDQAAWLHILDSLRQQSGAVICVDPEFGRSETVWLTQACEQEALATLAQTYGQPRQAGTWLVFSARWD